MSAAPRKRARARILKARILKVGWSFGDQALSSGTNFVLTILVARSVSAAEFGAFAIGIGVYLVCLTLGRSSISETIILSLGRRQGLAQTEAAAGLSATLLLSVAAAAVILGAAALVPSSDVSRILLVLALGLPGLLVQDYRRMVFFALGQPHRAFWSDFSWAVLQFTGIVIATAYGVRDGATLLGIWALSGLVSGLLWPRTTRGWIRQKGLVWLWGERAFALPLAGEGLLFQLGNQVSVFLLGALAGLAEAGAYRGTQTLFGPVTVFLLGLRTAILPGLMRMSRRSRGRALTLAARITFGAAGAAALWGLLLMSLPDDVGTEILGPTWATAAMLIWLVTIDRACNAISWGAGIRLRILLRPTLSLMTRTVATVSSLLVAAIGAPLGGAWGVALGTAMVSPFLALLGLATVRWARRSRVGQEPEDAGSAIETSGDGADRMTR